MSLFITKIIPSPNRHLQVDAIFSHSSYVARRMYTPPLKLLTIIWPVHIPHTGWHWRTLAESISLWFQGLPPYLVMTDQSRCDT